MTIPRLIVIGASAGGVTAIEKIFSQLEDGFAIPIAVVLHISGHANLDLQSVYSAPRGVRLHEVEDKMTVQNRNFYFAAPDYHMLLEKDFTFSLSQDDHVHFSRPSIDVFFESVAESLGESCLGLLLTGANVDGAKGLKKIAEKGGGTIVQNVAEAEVPQMPAGALAIMKPDHIMTIDQMAQFLNRMML